jgi:cytochrome c2
VVVGAIWEFSVAAPKTKFPIILIFALLGLVLPSVRSEENALQFQVGDKTVALSLADLKAKIAGEKITLFTPFSEKMKNYEAFSIQDVLSAGFGPGWHAPEYSHIAFSALDGYESVVEVARLTEKGGYLAFRDLDVASGWEPIGKRNVNPAPYFLVWTGEKQAELYDYPWPWQIATIKLVRFETQYPEVVPQGASPNSRVWNGFELFKTYCIACHAMNRQGGHVGPDLAAPRNITSYRSKKFLKEFIRKPSQFRYTKMNSHEQLTDRDLEDLYAYLKFQGNKKRR